MPFRVASTWLRLDLGWAMMAEREQGRSVKEWLTFVFYGKPDDFETRVHVRRPRIGVTLTAANGRLSAECGAMTVATVTIRPKGLPV